MAWPFGLFRLGRNTRRIKKRRLWTRRHRRRTIYTRRRRYRRSLGKLGLRQPRNIIQYVERVRRFGWRLQIQSILRFPWSALLWRFWRKSQLARRPLGRLYQSLERLLVGRLRQRNAWLLRLWNTRTNNRLYRPWTLWKILRRRIFARIQRRLNRNTIRS